MKKKWYSIVNAVIDFQVPMIELILMVAIIGMGINIICLIVTPVKEKLNQSWDEQSIDFMSLEEKKEMMQKIKRVNRSLDEIAQPEQP